MAVNTKQKVKYLTKFVIDFADTLADIDRNNITGIRVDKKRAGGEERSNYAIVFQVKNKIDKAELDDSNVIPDYFDITFPDSETRKIYTDIQVSGEIELHGHVGDQIVCNEFGYGPGSVGLYVKDPLDHIYAITNYHVVAQALLANNQFFYQNTQPHGNNVAITCNECNNQGIFTIGAVNKNVDVAFVRLHGGLGFTNRLPTGVANGIWSREKVLSSLKGQAVRVFSQYNNGTNAVVNSVLMPIQYPGTNIMINLIRLNSKVSAHGDSGGLVTDTLNRIVGIIMGADNHATYVVPFYEIVNFKHCFPI